MSRKKTVQDFQFGSRLGEGSYSQVFKGVDVASRKVFAIKVLSKKHIVKEKKIKYVNIEKITLNRLGRHPGIVTLHYTFQDDNSLYFVIDLAEHGELLTLIRKLGSLSENCAKYYMIQLIDAVDFMHKRGVIHRDLKPENILLNGDMKLMITDFGAAKILDLDDHGKVIENEEAFAKGSFVGTAEYVSPELLKHNKCGFESDVWAIGCILYQFIIGVPPFKGKTEYATFEKIVNLQYQWPNYFIPELVKDIVSRLLKSEPEERLTMSQLQQHPWFSRLKWDDKSQIWGVQPPKMEQYRPVVEQQLQQTTQQMNKIIIQKKLPAATVKKQLLNSTISQIRGDIGNNPLYNGVVKDSTKKPTPGQPQFVPPVKPVNGINGSPSSANHSPISPARPLLPQIQPVSPHHQKPQMAQPQQYTPPRPVYPPQGLQRSPNQQRPSPVPQLTHQKSGGSPIGMRGPPLTVSEKQQAPLLSHQQNTSPTRLRGPLVVLAAQQAPRQSPSRPSQPEQRFSPAPLPPVIRSTRTPVSSPVAASSEHPSAPVVMKEESKTPAVQVSSQSTKSSVTSSAHEGIIRAAKALESPVPPAVPSKQQMAPETRKVSKPVPSSKPSSNPDDVKSQKLPTKPVSKPPMLALPPKPKSPNPALPRVQPPSIVTKSTPSPISRPMPKSTQSPISSPRTYTKQLQSNGVVKGPTAVLSCLSKDEHIVKLDFINFAELDFASLRTFDPTSSLSKLNKNLGLDDVLIHEIITKNKDSLNEETERVVLVITDRGNLFLFTCTNVEQLTYQMGIDLTDKMFAMYDYEFSENDQSGYLILEVLKLDKLVFLSPLAKQVKKDLMEVATIQQGTSMSWIDALMKTKELLKSKASTPPMRASPGASTPSPKSATASYSSTRGTTPTNISTTASTNTGSAGRRVSSNSTLSSKTVPRVVVKNTSTNGKKPKTTQQIQQQNKKFAGGAAAAAFKSAR